MNALTLLNNFERELARPFGTSFWGPRWLSEDLANEASFNHISSVMNYDEKKAAWNLTLELAGVAKDSLKIDTHESHIVVSGEKTRGVEPGKFEARYNMPKGVDSDKIEATFEDGVLSLEIPMLEKKPTKTIQVK